MRKVFGLVMVVVALCFLGMAYSQFAEAATPDCESPLAAQIVALAKSDKAGILDMQLQLTALKLARETLAANETTVEQYIKKQSALIEKLDKDDVRKNLRILYQKNGEQIDAERIQTALQESVDKAKNASYFDRTVRFKNKDLSAYVLAKMLPEDESGDNKSVYDMNDVSILWLQSEISEGVEGKTYRGSAAANLQEVSTLVAQLTGVAGTKGKSQDEIGQMIADMEQIIGEKLDQVATTFSDEQKKACFGSTTCTNCKVTDKDKQGALEKALKEIGQSLVQDDSARDAAVKKAIAGLEAKGVSVERDPADVKDSEKKAEKLSIPSKKTEAVTKGATTPVDQKVVKVTADFFGSSLPQTNPELNPNPLFSLPKNSPFLGVSGWHTPTDSAAKNLNLGVDLGALRPKTDNTRVVKPIIKTGPLLPDAKKPTNPLGPLLRFPGPLKVSTSYNLANTPTRYKDKCSGSFSFVRSGDVLKVEFFIQDSATSTTLCKGDYEVKSLEYKAWDDNAATAVCMKQYSKFINTCHPIP